MFFSALCAYLVYLPYGKSRTIMSSGKASLRDCSFILTNDNSISAYRRWELHHLLLSFSQGLV